MALCLLLTSLTLPAARAGTYTWTQTDPVTKITTQSPTYTGGTYQGRVGPQGQPDTSPQPDAWGTSTIGGVRYTGWGGDASFPASVGCSGKITATFTWQPAPGQTLQSDPPPQTVIVTETGAASAYSDSYSPSPAAASSYDDGLGSSGAGVQTILTGPHPGTSSSGLGHDTKYSVMSGGATVTVSRSLSASASGVLTEAWASVRYSAAVSPITIVLKGVTIDLSDSSFHVLTGQQVTALLNSPFTVSNYRWSFIGATGYNPFRLWDPSLSSSPQFVPLSLVDKTQSSISFYDAHSDTVTVNCTATVTPPTGLSLNVNAVSKSITYHKPTLSWTVNKPFIDPNGVLQKSGFFGNQPSGAFSANELWGPMKITVPPLFAVNNTTGSGALLQIASLSRSNTRVPLNGFPSSYTKLSIMYTNGTSGAVASPTGLDVSFPYAYGYFQNSDGTLSYSDGAWLAQNNGYSGDGPFQRYINHDQDGGGNAWNASTASDSFNTWVMYQPAIKDDQGVIYVPLQTLTWSWGGNALLNNLGLWNVIANPSFMSTQGSDTDNYPSWTLSIASPFNIGP